MIIEYALLCSIITVSIILHEALHLLTADLMGLRASVKNCHYLAFKIVVQAFGERKFIQLPECQKWEYLKISYTPYPVILPLSLWIMAVTPFPMGLLVGGSVFFSHLINLPLEFVF